MADITIIQGEGKTIPLTFVDEDGDVVDLTSATMSFKLAKNLTEVALISKTHSDFDMTDAALGIAYFDVSTTETNIAVGAYLGQGNAHWTATNSDKTRLFIIVVDPAII